MKVDYHGALMHVTVTQILTGCISSARIEWNASGCIILHKLKMTIASTAMLNQEKKYEDIIVWSLFLKTEMKD